MRKHERLARRGRAAGAWAGGPAGARAAVLLAALSGALAGCPYVPPETSRPHVNVTEPVTGADYWLYVPSSYTADRDWPLVVTLHGTEPWDGRTRQILEWKDTAERNGLIVVAPALESTQGPVPVIPSVWYASEQGLRRDERVILAVIEQVRRNYRIDGHAILLTGFSSGGFPLYYVGLRNPTFFDMLIARDCNSTLELFRRIEISQDAKKLPIMIFWGRDDLQTIRDQSWDAFRYLREHGCLQTQQQVIRGGHLRRPDLAYKVWSRRLAGRRAG
jgi:predicted esterase